MISGGFLVKSEHPQSGKFRTSPGRYGRSLTEDVQLNAVPI
jgi:hypothetical protein